MGFKGIIFDLNGVLWWDTHLQEEAWRQFSQGFRGVPLSSDETAVHVHGRNNRHTLEYLAGRSIDETEVQALSEQKEQIYRQLCLDQGAAFRLSPGAEELLSFLVAHQIARTIATASGRENVEFFVAHLDLGRWFELEGIVYDDGTLCGKPAPDMYLQAAARLGLEPAHCVVVEDSRSGIQAALAARIGCVVALGPAPDHDALSQLDGVDIVVEDLSQLARHRLFRL